MDTTNEAEGFQPWNRYPSNLPSPTRPCPHCGTADTAGTDIAARRRDLLERERELRVKASRLQEYRDQHWLEWLEPEKFQIQQLIKSRDSGLKRPYPWSFRPDPTVNALGEKYEEDQGSRTVALVTSKMHKAVRPARRGEMTILELIRSLNWGTNSCNKRLEPERVVKSVAAILYDQEWTGKRRQGMIPDHTALDYNPLMITYFAPYAFEMMLLVDYGFPPHPIQPPSARHRQAFFGLPYAQFEKFSRFLVGTASRWNEGHIPGLASWDKIAWKMTFWSHTLDVWDSATLLYYYHTRRKPVSSEDAKQGWTGYTGVLQEMINEIPVRGTDRLARKLSLDINILIPKFVSDEGKRAILLCRAKRLVEDYHLSVWYWKPVSSWRDAARERSAKRQTLKLMLEWERMNYQRDEQEGSAQNKEIDGLARYERKC